MRIGEFAPCSQMRVQMSVLSGNDMQFSHSGSRLSSVVISFPHAKNNQRGPPQKVRWIPYPAMTLCPVRALWEFAQLRPHSADTFFCHFDGSPFTQYQFNAMLQRAARFVSLPTSAIHAHSFQLGVPEAAIRDMGCWRSDAFLTYIRPIPVCQLVSLSFDIS